MLQCKQITWLAKIAFFITALFAVQTANATTNTADTESPLVLTQNLSNTLFNNLKQDRPKIEKNTEHLKTLVRQDLMQHVNVRAIGNMILGDQYRKSISEEQKTKFYDALEKYIVYEYAKVLALYDGQELTISQHRDKGNMVEILVTIKTKGKAEDNKVIFLWHKSKKGRWLAIDMTTAAGSMVEAQQQHWTPEIRKKGIDAVIAELLTTANKQIVLSKD